MVFQEFDQLLPWKTVKQNVCSRSRPPGQLSGQARPRSARMAYLEKVNLTRVRRLAIRTRCPAA